jgi:hypothetical protein
MLASAAGVDPDGHTRAAIVGERRSDRSHTVLWSLGHGPYADYTPSGWYSDLVDALEYRDIVSYETTYSLEYVYLDAYDVIVIGTVLAWDSAYTPAELAAVQDFVDAGGALLVLGDNSDTPNEHINPITEAYDVTCQVTGSEPGSDITDVESHAVFAGVSEISLVGPGSLFVSAPGETLARASGGEAVVGLSGAGGVIVIGDCNFCENDYMGLADNEAFILNVFEYLADYETGIPDGQSTSWGRVKAGYR